MITRPVLVALVCCMPILCVAESKPPSPRSVKIEGAAIAELQEAMRAGQFTSRALVEAYLERIEKVDQGGLNSIIELNPDALAIAAQLDRERKEKGARGPLHGIPILIKDNIDTADRMETTAGSLALLGSKPARDAYVVERLRAAGAIILGKTNLSEWANFRSSRSSSGWSGRGGQTRNPYALDRNPSGSSSGSAAAVSAWLAAGAVGSETDGSIVSPASVCGIVGLKPTVGLVSRSGIIPIAHSQDTAGPMGCTVADVAAILAAMTGPDPRDPATSAREGASHVDYLRSLDRNGLNGARIGVVRAEAFHLSEKVTPILDTAVDALRHGGATVLDPVDLPNVGKTDDSELDVLLYEFKADIATYLASRPGSPVRTLADLITFNNQHRETEMPYFGQDLFEKADKKGPLTEQTYLDALKKDQDLTRAQGIDAVMNREKLDALVAITNGPASLTDLVNGDLFTGGSSSPAAVAGYPSITVPAGFVQGLPVGVSFFGRAWSEATLIRLAYAFEQATRARRPPELKPALDIPVRAFRRSQS